MDDFFSQLSAAAQLQPSPHLLKQLREVPGVREISKHRYTILPGVTVRFEINEGAWKAFLDKQGRLQTFTLQTATEERKFIEAIKRTAQGREED